MQEMYYIRTVAFKTLDIKNKNSQEVQAKAKAG